MRLASAATPKPKTEILATANQSVLVFSRTATGNVAPTRTITGGSTGLKDPVGLAVDNTHEEVFVSNANNSGSDGSVTVYPRTADGNTAPVRTIVGGATGLFRTVGVALDLTRDEVFATNYSGSIAVHSRTASGNVAPLRRISGPNTLLNSAFGTSPAGLAFDTVNGEVIAGNAGNDALTVFDRLASGDVAPLRNITSALSGLNSPVPWQRTPRARRSL